MTQLDKTSDNKPISRWIWLGCMLFVIAAALHSASKVVGGGDTWVAMECGRFTLWPWAQKHPGRTWQMRLLDKVGIHATKCDPYSATSRAYIPGDPQEFGWVNQNWLTHVMFYKMKTALGGDERAPQKGEALIVIYKFFQAVLTALFAYWAARVLGAHPTIASAAAAFGILLSRSFVDLRPNVSTIFFAAIMILLLAYWRNNRHRALLWMIPVMIIGSNVHGGFIYPIMVFWIMLGGHLVMKLLHSYMPGGFPQMTWRSLRWLLAMAVVVTLIPGIFSPFGWENLLHPFIVATGGEGKIWRDVIEWKPIWDSSGFGNEKPYIYFLLLFVAVFLAWLVLCFLRPPQSQTRRRRQQRTTEGLHWPRIDLAHLGIMGITIYMSLASRRFIFLGGVVLAPFLAQMFQEIIDMWQLRRRYRQSQPLELPSMGRKTAIGLAGLSVLAALTTGVVYAMAMWDLYYRPTSDGEERTVFRRMVGIKDQPVRAIRFFDDNQVKGVVFNEWTNGGFIAFGQRPNPETGEPPCKVFMDGRSQAAYKVRHFQYWRTLRTVPSKQEPKYYTRIEQMAKQSGMSPTDPKFFDGLFNKMVALKKEDFTDIKAFQKDQQHYRSIIHFALGNPELFNNLLKRDNINVALLSFRRSNDLINLFSRSRNWVLFYIDDRNVIFFRRNAPENAELLQKGPDGLRYPDEYSRNFSLGYIYAQSSDAKTAADGLRMLMSVERYVPRIYDYLYRRGLMLGMDQELWEYFTKQRQIYKPKVDMKVEKGRLQNVIAMAHSCRKLGNLAKKMKKPADSQKFFGETEKYDGIIGKINKKRALW